jgi:hypothetical protein
MMKRSLLCAILLLSLAGSGVSQTVKTGPAFYVVLNSLTRTCTIVDRTPRTDTPNVTVASDAIFKTRAEAEAAIKTLTSCNQLSDARPDETPEGTSPPAAGPSGSTTGTTR